MNKNIKNLFLIGVSVALCTGFLSGCEKANKPSFSTPKKISDYLYSIEYNDYIAEIAGSSIPTGIKGGCSSVRNGNFFGRNLDMSYCDCPEFVVRMNASKNRFASIGLCANPYIGTDVSKLSEAELLRMPTITNDGINENGVIASVHIVLTDGVDDRKGTNEGGEILDGRAVVRYVLDHATSAEHAISLLEKANIVGGFEQYGLHWMIADEKDTYIVEIIDGSLSVSKNTFQFFTNFYLNYGPVQEQQTIAGTTFDHMPLFNEQAIGVERYDYIRSHYEESKTFDGMATVMENIKATVMYHQDENKPWFTEYMGDGITIHSSKEEFQKAAFFQQEMHENRDRQNPKGDWISWHTTVYDIKNRKFTVWSQEDFSHSFEFSLEK